MIRRLSIAVAFACLGIYYSPVVGQDTPLTRLVPIEGKTETGFVADAVRRLWRIEEPKNYHRAGVKVSCPTSSAGSGIIVRVTDDKIFCVLTNHHVIAGCEGRMVDLIAMNGQRSNGKVVWWDADADVAVIINSVRGVANGVPVLDGEVKPGDEVTVVSFGGPGRMVPKEDIRPFIGRVLTSQYRAKVVVDAYTVSGDSGSGMIDRKTGALCGINWGHYGHPTQSIQGWQCGKPCASNVSGSDLVRILTQVCRPYGCRPIIRRPGQPVIIGQPADNGVYEPVPDTGDQAQADCDCDEEAIVKKIIEQYGDQLKGADGQDGADGRDGSPGSPGTPGPAPTQEQIQAAVAAYFAENPTADTISLALVDEQGREIDRDTVPLGGTLRLQFKEVK